MISKTAQMMIYIVVSFFVVFFFFLWLYSREIGADTAIGSMFRNIAAAATQRKPRFLWGAYVGNDSKNLAVFEKMAGKKVNIYAHFSGWDESFPMKLQETVGKQGKTLLIFWEPMFGYDDINSGAQDRYIRSFASSAKAYKYPVILVPFPEMNLNEAAWGYGINDNSAPKFVAAWRRVKNLFYGEKAKNVKFGLAYNSSSIPDVKGNQFDDYYPGQIYVDYVGVDGFNFRDPWLNFNQIFDEPMNKLYKYKKPIYIFSMGSISDPNKAAWIRNGLGKHIYKYKNVVGWVWFNQGGSPNWLIDSDKPSLEAFKSVLP